MFQARRLAGPALVGLLAAVLVLLVTLQLVAGYRPAYYAAATRPEVRQATGLEASELRAAIQRVLDYSLGRRSDLQFTMPAGSVRAGEPGFSERELDHMMDVRGLFAYARRVTGVILLSGLLLLLWPAGLRRPCTPCAIDRSFWAATMQWAGLLGIVSVAGIGLAGLANFTQAFDVFHNILFTNDLWQLPADSLLIMMLPEWQFARLAAATGVVVVIASAVLLLAGRRMSAPLAPRGMAYGPSG